LPLRDSSWFSPGKRTNRTSRRICLLGNGFVFGQHAVLPVHGKQQPNAVIEVLDEKPGDT
jgi:hypothetical protein